MKASLVSRKAIADTVELCIRGHAHDALVAIADCDKFPPAMMMAMSRLNVPSVFIHGGSILPGKFDGRDVTVQDVYEAVGMHSSAGMSERRLERVTCPSSGPCGGQFTANTMANEAGFEFTPLDVAEVFKKTPYIAAAKTSGPAVCRC